MHIYINAYVCVQHVSSSCLCPRATFKNIMNRPFQKKEGQISDEVWCLLSFASAEEATGALMMNKVMCHEIKKNLKAARLSTLQ